MGVLYSLFYYKSRIVVTPKRWLAVEVLANQQLAVTFKY